MIRMLIICTLMLSILTGCSKESSGKKDTIAVDKDAIKENIVEESALEENKADNIVLENHGTSENHEGSEEQTTSDERGITDDQAIEAVRNYCYSCNPDLEDIVNEGQYPVYWEVSSATNDEIVILYRSYTGAQNRYYINRDTGDTYVTEFVPGITEEEVKTGENFNLKDYIY